jgi:Ca-activated chloride channel family protein
MPTEGEAVDGEVIRVNTSLVSVPVRVMDRKGRFIGGLTRENFKVFENGTEQELALFSNENEPFTVALVLDMSYSTKFKLAEIQSAAIAFIDQLRPEDRVLVASFDADVHFLCDPTNDRKEIYRAIKSTRIATGTSLYEAVDSVMNKQLRGVEGRKAIILFTDGVDTTSRRKNDADNLHDAMELDSLIYTIKYDTFADVQAMKNRPIVQQPTIPLPTSTPNPIPQIPMIGLPSEQGTTAAEYQRAGEYLQGLADRTGGRLYEATSLTNLADAYSKIASELREFYSVGYYPNEDRDPGRAATVKVKVDREGAVVRARETFIRRKKSGR